MSLSLSPDAGSKRRREDDSLQLQSWDLVDAASSSESEWEDVAEDPPSGRFIEAFPKGHRQDEWDRQCAPKRIRPEEREKAIQDGLELMSRRLARSRPFPEPAPDTDERMEPEDDDEGEPEIDAIRRHLESLALKSREAKTLYTPAQLCMEKDLQSQRRSGDERLDAIRKVLNELGYTDRTTATCERADTCG